MGKFDDKLDELVKRGWDADVIEELRDASGLRSELNNATSQAQQTQAQNTELMARLQRLEDDKWKTSLRDMGTTVNPTILTRPADLDVTDSEAMRKWATDNGLVATTPAGDSATTLASHDRASTLSGGSDTIPAPIDQAKAAALNATSEDEFYKAIEQIGPVTSK